MPTAISRAFVPVPDPDLTAPTVAAVAAGANTVTLSDTLSKSSADTACAAIAADLNDLKAKLRLSGLIETSTGTGVVCVRRISLGEFHIWVPVASAPNAHTVTEWRLKRFSTGVWAMQGCYARDLHAPASDVQLSDATDTSVSEYVWKAGIEDAAAIGYDFLGCGHLNEALTAHTMTLDGSNILTMAIGAIQFGAEVVSDQASNMLLPLNANGSVNGVTVIGTSSLKHTFNAAGLLVEHGHVMNAGYKGYYCFVAACPTSYANINRMQMNALSVYTPVGDGSIQNLGTELTTYSAWHTTAHRYKITMDFPSGVPNTTSDWSHAGPEKGFFEDTPLYGKVRVVYVGSTYADRFTTGTTAHAQRYVVSWV